MSAKKKTFKTILVIPDLHIPFHHIHAFRFLSEVANAYKPDKVVCLGDEQDLHSVSFHNHSPDLHSPKDELNASRIAFKELFKLFPEVDLVDSNHGSLFYRRAAANGLPNQILKSYNEILGAPSTWRWHPDLTLYASNGSPIYFCHGQSSDALKNSKNRSMNYAQGHHHSKFSIQYWANSLGLYWGVTSGCLIDYKSLAFEYGRTMLDKPILGCTVIREGHPILVPMVLNTRGQWIGRLP